MPPIAEQLKSHAKVRLLFSTQPRGFLQPRGHASCGPGFWFQTKITDGNEGDASDSGVAVEPCRGV